eukprot:CAMPEP_0198282278 /NCGR_PEP_ID=MMETSP1449-20131203/2126_1 /TAXON_ID=420275 /ORGANISM="Attheya septentrionalis, Strain CCMP2084" /LENGTH=593 /DNA_ID=CAMNT_0043978475 /DNA_START=223 /DNA_END=2004 /DNA_ORIENTATION=+
MSNQSTAAYAMWPPASQPTHTSVNISELDQQSTSLTWLERNSPTGDVPKALLGTGRFCGGVMRDYKGRIPHLLSDVTNGMSWKTLSAALFMFCATVTSTVALGDVAYRETDGMVGITEYLMLQGVAGAFHSLFSACPLPILRPTGPITAFMIDLYQLSAWVGVGYYSLLSWVGFWVGIFFILIALFDLSRYIALCTRFLHDIYAVFVCTIYITDGIIGVRQRFQKVEWAQAFFAGYLALFCILFSLGFYYIDRSVILKQRWRSTISDYAVPLAVIICIGISYAVKDEVEVDRIEMPRNFEPTYDSAEDGEKRSWYQGPGDGGWFAAAISMIAAIPIVALFYIDHLFSCILGQKPKLGLTKGEYYHSSMLITGLCNLILPSFGLPFVTASLPHSPQFTKALTDYDKTRIPWKVTKVHESRVAPMLVYMLCFCGLVVPSVLELCPEGVVNGTLTFVGLQGILPGTGNQLMDRCVLLLTAPSEFRDHSNALYAQLPWRRIHLYTLVQLSCLAACWGMRFTGPFSLAFPLVIVGFIPLRLYVLPKLFTAEELAVLDSDGASESKTEQKNEEPESHPHDYEDDDVPHSVSFVSLPPLN